MELKTNDSFKILYLTIFSLWVVALCYGLISKNIVNIILLIINMVFITIIIVSSIILKD